MFNINKHAAHGKKGYGKKVKRSVNGSHFIHLNDNPRRKVQFQGKSVG